jgi:hypothetical protein
MDKVLKRDILQLGPLKREREKKLWLEINETFQVESKTDLLYCDVGICQRSLYTYIHRVSFRDLDPR